MWEEVSTKVNIYQLELELQYEKALAESAAEAAATAAAEEEAAAAAAAETQTDKNAPRRTSNFTRASSVSPALTGAGANSRVRHSISTTLPVPRPSPRQRQRKSLIGGVKLFGKTAPDTRLKSMPWLHNFIDYKFSLFDRTSELETLDFCQHLD